MEQPLPDPNPGPPGPAERLDSWKEIAGYLRRSPRTVQRWERQEGLPVHRLVHDKLGSVYAFRSELDGWWAERRSRLESDADETTAAVDDTPEPGRRAEPEQKAEPEQRVDASPPPESERPGPPHGSPRLLAGISVSAALLIAAALAWWAIGRKPQTSTARPVRLAIFFTLAQRTFSPNFPSAHRGKPLP